MITLTASASCRCGWTTGPADWDTADRAARKHLARGEPGCATCVTATPAASTPAGTPHPGTTRTQARY